jgi:hypothetical protein
MKPFKETAVGKFLASKGFDTVLNAIGPKPLGINILGTIKDLVLGSPEYKNMSPEDQQQFLGLYEQEIKEMDLILQDVANARQREVEIAKTTKKDWMMALTGAIVLAAFLFLIYAVVYIQIPKSNEALFNIMIGAVMGSAGTVVAYYYGSSKGSQDKTDLLKQQQS